MAKKTALYDMHIKYGGKIVEFCGYELPIQYSSIVQEHNAVRNLVGLFDVSHMGEIIFSGEGALNTLNNLLTNDFTNMVIGGCRYAMMLYHNGTIVDDVIVYKAEETSYLVIVNASNKDKDYDWMQSNKLANTTVTDVSDSFSQVAIQGPKAEEVLSKIADILPKKRFTYVKDSDISGCKCIISRTGYTGEDGFEIYMANNDATKVWEAIMSTGEVLPCGLGARDTLRLEAAMPLYGHELTDTIMGNETGMGFAVKMDKPFIGRDALLNNPPKYRHIGLTLIDRGIPREHNAIFVDGEEVGFVTSGTMSPLTKKAIAMARILKSVDATELIVDVRGKQLRANITSLPFNK